MILYGLAYRGTPSTVRIHFESLNVTSITGNKVKVFFL